MSERMSDSRSFRSSHGEPRAAVKQSGAQLSVVVG